MYAGEDFIAASPNEVEFYTLDFVRAVGKKLDGSPDSITSVAWSLTVANGSDPAASSHLDSPTVSGTRATVHLTGLLAGVRYRLTALATLASGQKVELHSFVSCR